MCGIAGSVHFPLSVKRLNSDLFHRGPDSSSNYIDGVVTLHHNRLSIQDIAGGGQPMTFGGCTIVYNGEIYNHKEVRDRLRIQGTTNSDTETILLSYLKKGKDCLSEFDGMFAFAIYDRSRQLLFLARDRVGEKPLYYYISRDSFAFASELNALQAQVHSGVSDSNISNYLLYGGFHGSATPYNEIKELLPGHYAYVNIPDCKFNSECWWQYDNTLNHVSDMPLDEAVEYVDDLLHLSVKNRIESSDLEVGSFLSSGIDSGIITAIAASYKSNLRTFTASFTGSYNEAPLAKQVAVKYNTLHTEIPISLDGLSYDIERILSNYGEPFFDDSAIPSFYVSREARKYLTVILNGDGSDELFGGYRRYVPFSKYDLFKKNKTLKTSSSILKNIFPVSNEKMSLLNYIYRMLDMTSQQGVNVYYSATTDLFFDFRKHLIINNVFDPLENLFNSVIEKEQTGLAKMLEMDFKCLLPDILLVKMDIAAMANSLEGRSPFLSKDILDFAPKIPDQFKVQGLKTKYLLRRLANKYLPAGIVSQPKRGFETPLKNWVDGVLGEIILDYLRSIDSYSRNYVSPFFIEQLIDRKVNISDEKRAKMLYCLFALDVWHTKSYIPSLTA